MIEKYNQKIDKNTYLEHRLGLDNGYAGPNTQRAIMEEDVFTTKLDTKFKDYEFDGTEFHTPEIYKDINKEFMLLGDPIDGRTKTTQYHDSIMGVITEKGLMYNFPDSIKNDDRAFMDVFIFGVSTDIKVIKDSSNTREIKLLTHIARMLKKKRENQTNTDFLQSDYIVLFEIIKQLPDVPNIDTINLIEHQELGDDAKLNNNYRYRYVGTRKIVNGIIVPEVKKKLFDFSDLD